MKNAQIHEIAQSLHSARLERRSLPQFSKDITDFKREDAYSIQEEGIKLREKSGEKIIALKMGLTSEGKRKQMNLDSPLYGVLTDKMKVENQGTFHIKNSIHPKIEPEIAFFIKSELKGKITHADVLNATEAVCAALEILDSRYDGFKYFSMEDVIADNSSSSHFILGPKFTEFRKLDLKNLKMQMKVNGETKMEGFSKDISDDPVISVIQLAELLALRGQSIPAGCVVMAGAATAAIALEPGMTVSLEVDSLPHLAVNIKE
ncbi:MAG TPA: fumarylacetoacetate hydrolase family protein [Bacteriovoracaceae bacterium]|nr:fumarylacetoacetate hydrolase family protein [Bacteriovoracaceae bacterium]